VVSPILAPGAFLLIPASILAQGHMRSTQPQKLPRATPRARKGFRFQAWRAGCGCQQKLNRVRKCPTGVSAKRGLSTEKTERLTGSERAMNRTMMVQRVARPEAFPTGEPGRNGNPGECLGDRAAPDSDGVGTGGGWKPPLGTVASWQTRFEFPRNGRRRKSGGSSDRLTPARALDSLMGFAVEAPVRTEIPEHYARRGHCQPCAGNADVHGRLMQEHRPAPGLPGLQR